MLLKSGADSNLAMADGRTPIHIASEAGNIGVIRLLLEKREEKSQTIFRLKTFALWLTVNSMDEAAKSEVLKLFNFEDFTFKELNSDVRKSGLFPVDKIMDRNGGTL